MHFLFIHTNFPGQFVHLAHRLASHVEHDVSFITQTRKRHHKSINVIAYRPRRRSSDTIHHYLRSTETAVLNGQAVAEVAMAMESRGERPDIIIAHPGWGESLFLKDIWPDVPLILLGEYFYRGKGSDVGFDPEFGRGLDDQMAVRTRTGFHHVALSSADAIYAPTYWQKQQFPDEFQEKISVIHDGINTETFCPNKSATFQLPSGKDISHGDELLTFVSRSLEPYRGFHSFMRALPQVLEKRENLQVIIVGGDQKGYGPMPAGKKSWREVMLSEVGPLPDRVHFVGQVSLNDFRRIVQVSALHVYLTYPFVLSWSVLEAMSAGALVVGSSTPPVKEVIEDGKNGFLADFFQTEELAELLVSALQNRDQFDQIRRAARKTIVERYALPDCLRKQEQLIRQVMQKS